MQTNRREGTFRSLLRWLTTAYFSRWDAVCHFVFLTILFRDGSYAIAFSFLMLGAILSGIVKGTLERDDDETRRERS